MGEGGGGAPRSGRWSPCRECRCGCWRFGCEVACEFGWCAVADDAVAFAVGEGGVVSGVWVAPSGYGDDLVYFGAVGEAGGELFVDGFVAEGCPACVLFVEDAGAELVAAVGVGAAWVAHGVPLWGCCLTGGGSYHPRYE